MTRVSVDDTAVEGRERVPLVRAIRAMAAMFARETLTRGRLLALGALGVLVVLLGWAARTADDPVEAGAEVQVNFALTVMAPIVVLVIASATLGGLRADKTLVYVWLRPVPRWSIAVSAAIATLLIGLPLVVVPMVLGGLLGGESDVVMGALVGGIVAVVGYTGVFIPMGAALRRSFIVGLVYIVVWEGLLSRLGEGFAALSVQGYAAAAVSNAVGFEAGSATYSEATTVIVPCVFLAMGLAVATWWLYRREVD